MYGKIVSLRNISGSTTVRMWVTSSKPMSTDTETKAVMLSQLALVFDLPPVKVIDMFRDWCVAKESALTIEAAAS